MDISATQSNIAAAFDVVRKTYSNLEKFFKELDEEADKAGYEPLITSSPRYLRYKSDVDVWGWMVSDFIKLYQLRDTENPEAKAGDENAAIFAIKVNIEGKEGPVIQIVKYEFLETSWTGTIPINSHWQFYWPLESKDHFILNPDASGRSISTPRDNKHADEKYRGLRRVVWVTRDLVGITPESIGELIAAWKTL